MVFYVQFAVDEGISWEQRCMQWLMLFTIIRQFKYKWPQNFVGKCSFSVGKVAILHADHTPSMARWLVWGFKGCLVGYTWNLIAMGLLPDTQYCGLRMRRECRERFPHRRGLTIPTCITARAWHTCRDANQRFPLKSVTGKTFPAFPVHTQPAILCIWWEAHV